MSVISYQTTCSHIPPDTPTPPLFKTAVEILANLWNCCIKHHNYTDIGMVRNGRV